MTRCGTPALRPHAGRTDFPVTSLTTMALPYCAGREEHQVSFKRVSRGCGFVGLPMRIGTPEIVRSSRPPERVRALCRDRA
jgi:hypothetical protein